MAVNERAYTTRRMAIVKAMSEALKVIDGSEDYNTDLEARVEPRLKFWDEVNEYPSVHLSAGNETRDYQGAGVKDRYLNVTIRVYIEEEDAVFALEGLLEDIETVLEVNSRLAYKDRLGTTHYTQQITIISIDTDEGVLEPLGVGEIVCEVRY
jgi:hypothetical protein